MTTMFTLSRAAFGIALLCSGFAAASALVSTDGTTVPTRVVVNYGDLDLTQPEAAETLYRRIGWAARRACDEPAGGELTQMSRYKTCYRMAVADAVNKVNAQTLTALHRLKTQSPLPG